MCLVAVVATAEPVPPTAPVDVTLTVLEPEAVVHDPILSMFRAEPASTRLHLELDVPQGAVEPVLDEDSSVAIRLLRSDPEDVPRHTSTQARVSTQGCSTLPSRACVDIEPPSTPGRYAGHVQLRPSNMAVTARAPFSLVVRLPWWIAFVLAIAGASVSVVLVGILDDQRRNAEQLRVLAQLQRDVSLARSERFVTWMTAELASLPGRRLSMDAFRAELDKQKLRLARFGQLQALVDWRQSLADLIGDRVAREAIDDRLVELDETLHASLPDLDDEDAFARLRSLAEELRDDAAKVVTSDVVQRSRGVISKAEALARRLRHAAAQVQSLPEAGWIQRWQEEADAVQGRLAEIGSAVAEPEGGSLRAVLAAAQQDHDRRADGLAEAHAEAFALLGELQDRTEPTSTLESVRTFGAPAQPRWRPSAPAGGSLASFRWSARSLASAAEVAGARLSTTELAVQGVLVVTLGLAYLVVFYFTDPSWGSGTDCIGALFFGLGLQFTAATPAAELYESISSRFGRGAPEAAEAPEPPTEES